MLSARRFLSYAMAITLAFGQVQPSFATNEFFRLNMSGNISLQPSTELPPDLSGNNEPSGDLLIDISPSVRARLDVPMNLRLTAQGASGAVEWDYAGGNLPSGLTFSSSAGTISGTPTELENSPPLIVRTIDSEGRSGLSRAFIIEVKPPPSITLPSDIIADGQEVFSLVPTTSNVFGSQTWSVEGILPYGISIDPSNGSLSGRTQQTGSFADLRLKVIDGDGATGTSSPFTIESTTNLGIIGLAKSYRIRAGKPFYSAQPSTRGVTSSVVWSFADENNPPGLSVSPDTGIISGTPTEIGVIADSYVRIAQDDGQIAVHGPIKFDIVGDLGIDREDIYIRNGQAVSLSTPTTNRIGSLAWTLSGGLPSGLTFAADTGVISGKPTITGSTEGLVLSAIDTADGGRGESEPFAIHVWPSLNILPPGVPYSVVGEPIEIAAPTATGLRGTPTWSKVGSLPPGLSLDASTAKITGTPTVAGEWTFQYRVTDSSDLASSISRTITIEVAPAPIPGAITFTDFHREYSVRSGGTLTTNTPSLSNAHGEVSFSLAETAPSWLHVNAATGQVYGLAPIVTEETVISSLRLIARDADARTATSPSFSISVHPPGALGIKEIGPTFHATAEMAFSTGTPPIVGGSGSFELSLEGTLPDWLSFDANSGVISGTPPLGASGATGLLLSVDDRISGEHVISNPFDISIGNLSISGTATSYAAKVGTPFSSTQPTLRNVVSTYSFSLVGEALPDWASFNTATGVISGTPTEVSLLGPYSIRASDSAGQTALSSAFTLQVSAADPLRANANASYDAAFGEPFSILLGTTNAQGKITWSLETALPDWASLDANTGRISGTPDQVGTTTGIILRARDALGNSGTTRAFSIAVAPPPPLTIDNLPSTYQAEISNSFSASRPTPRNGTSPYSWSIASGTLPTWATLSSSTGIISGTPNTLTDSSGISLRVTDSTGNTAVSNAFDISVSPATLRVSSTPAPAKMRAGETLTTASPSISGATADITWSLARGTLPPWATLDASNGQISGVSVDAGKWSGIILQAKEAGTNRTASSAPITIEVVPAYPEIQVTTSVQARSYRELTVTPSTVGVIGTPTWRVSSGTLPSWLTLNTATGALTGTPTEIESSFTITLTVRDSRDSREGTSAAITIEVLDGTPYIEVEPSYEVRSSASFAIIPEVHDTIGATSWAITGGMLPDWASLNTASGKITGTPTTTTTAPDIRLTVTDSRGVSGHSSTFAITSAPPLIANANQTSFALRAGEQVLTATPTSSGVSGIATWSTKNTLPAGLTLDPNTGIISGIARSTGKYPITLTLTDSGDGASSNAVPYTISVLGAPTASIATDISARVGHEVDVLPSSTNTIGNVTWSVASGTLPAWASFDPATGRIRGIPTTAGNSTTAVLKLLDEDGATANTASFRFTVSSRIRVDLKSTTVAGRVQRSFSYAPLAADGAIGDVTWSLASGTLPTWATLDPSSGRISGTPTAATTFSFSLSATDTEGNVGTSSTISATITTNPIVSVSDRTTRVNASFSYQPGVSGVIGSYSTFSTGNALPSWAKISATGRITGVPDTTGSWTGLRLRVIDAEGVSGTSEPFSITVSSGISVDQTSSATQFRISSNVSVPAPTTSGTTGTVSWSLGSGSLPDGVSINSSTGLISGQAKNSGLFTYRVRATDLSDGAYALSAERTIRIWPMVSVANVPAEYVAHAETPFSLSPAPIARNIRGGQTWSVYQGTLPPWATLNTSTGQITGTPTDAGVWSNIRLRVLDSWDSRSAASAPFSIRIVPEMVVINMSTSYSARYGFPFIQAVPVARNAIGQVSWEVAQGTIPPWASFDSATGLISGTPDEIGNWNDIVIRATDATGAAATSVLFDISSYSEPSITMPSGALQFRIGTAASITPTGKGTVGSRLWGISNGIIPPGMSINPSTGHITGTPTTSGSYPFTVRMTDGYDGKFAEGNASPSVADALVLTNIDDEYRIRLGNYLSTGQAALLGARSSISFTSTGTLPAGISFSNGRYSGIPTTAQTAGTHTVVLRARDSYDNAYVDKSIKIVTLGTLSTVVPSFSLRSGEQLPGTRPTSTNAMGALSWSISSGTLPSGVTLNPTTGALTGTVSATERTIWSGIRLRVEDADGASAISNAFSITVDGPLDISGPTNGTGVKGTAFSLDITASRALANVSWSAMGLPPGLSISGSGTLKSIGTISGTPSKAGTYEVVVTARDTADNTAVSHTVSIFIDTVPVISMSNIVAYVGTAVSTTPTLTDKGNGTVTWKLTLPNGTNGVSSLPSGLSFNPATGRISGTPSSTLTTTSFRLQAIESRTIDGIAFQVGSNIVSFSVGSTLPILSISASPVSGQRGSPIPPMTPNASNRIGTNAAFNLYVYPSSGTGVLRTFSSISADGTAATTPYFPKGLSFDSATGKIAGTPEVTWDSGSYRYKIYYQETRTVNGSTYLETASSGYFAISVSNWAAPSITMGNVSATRAVNYPGTTPSVSNSFHTLNSKVFSLYVYPSSGTTSLRTFSSISSDGTAASTPYFPKGLSFDSATGKISGTPEVSWDSGSYRYKIYYQETRIVNGRHYIEGGFSPYFSIGVSNWATPNITMSNISASRGANHSGTTPSVSNSFHTLNSKVFSLYVYPSSGTSVLRTFSSISSDGTTATTPYFPKGLSFDSATGKIAGTPEVSWDSGSYRYKIYYQETRIVNGRHYIEGGFSPYFSIGVSNWAVPSITMGNVSATRAVNYSGMTPSVSNSFHTLNSKVFSLYVYPSSGTNVLKTFSSISAGGTTASTPYFPKGLTFDSTTGKIAGTPEVSWASGSYRYKIYYQETRIVNGRHYIEGGFSPYFSIGVY